MSRFVVKDSYYKKAKDEGLRARSAYKLKEIQDRFRVVRRGDKVLDLGCAPGSFLQVLAELVGPSGFAVGIDILPVAPLPQKNVKVVIEDVRCLDIPHLLDGQGFSQFDLITCDIAPNLSGIRDVDEANIEELSGAINKVVVEGLKRGGAFVFKSFFGSSLKGLSQDLAKTFATVKLFKPQASRSSSSEVYFICMGKR
jgi:23S rRNA (uridine2552-2'-O)-methyltransferase